ncbi:MAG: NCS2 family permease [Candidatus Micrarchaeota archaeon]|nr:NCS2 family permease [Candidatus Micrarchaeota archaeon]
MTTNLLNKIAEYFEFTKHKADFKTEILAGVSTFLALSYIFIVNPAILGQGGMNKGFVFFATVVASCITTLAMGLWAKKPLVLAPGLEMNGYVAFFVVGALGFTWQGALGAVFWEGVLCILLTMHEMRVRIIKAVPNSMKAGLSLSVGVFVAIIGLKISNILLYRGITISGIGALLSHEALVVYFGLAVILLLERFKITGSVLISIILATLLAYHWGLGATAAEVSALSQGWLDGFLKFDLGVILDPRMWSVILALFVIDFYGSIAKFIGLTRNTSIVDENGDMPQIKEAMLVDGAGTIIGAAAGTTSIITYVESAVGIGAGGRTGLTAVVCALLMLPFLLVPNLVGAVPVIAAGGALLFVGITLMPSRKELAKYSMVEIISVAMMALTVLFTFALDKAMLVGFGIYIIGSVVTGKARQVDIYLIISTILILVGLVLQQML